MPGIICYLYSTSIIFYLHRTGGERITKNIINSKIIRSPDCKFKVKLTFEFSIIFYGKILRKFLIR